MPDEKGKPRISPFPGRKSEVAKAVSGVIAKDQPTIGGNQGDFVRERCGTCLSWRRDSRAGQNGVPLTAGQCMFMPPSPHPILDETGQRILATMVVRPPMASDSEGCDQHDDGTDDEDGEGIDIDQVAPSRIAQAG